MLNFSDFSIHNVELANENSSNNHKGVLFSGVGLDRLLRCCCFEEAVLDFFTHYDR